LKFFCQKLQKNIFIVAKKIIHLKDIFGPIGADDTRVSVTQFASKIQPEILFKDGKNQSYVNHKVANIRFAEGGTMMGLALKKLPTEIFSAKAGARRNIRHEFRN